jgi:hypothetical protein
MSIPRGVSGFVKQWRVPASPVPNSQDVHEAGAPSTSDRVGRELQPLSHARLT